MSGQNKQVQATAIKEFKVVQGDIPETPPDGVVVKVQNAGICHSDVHASHGMFDHFVWPRVFGHEIGGVIHSIGNEAATAFPNLKKDLRVIVYPWGNCNKCNSCRSDGIPICVNMVPPIGQGNPDKFVYGIWKDGGYQNYVLVHDARFLVPVPDSVAMSEACMVPCSGITAYSATNSLLPSVERAISVNGKAAVGVFGTGGLALWAIQIMKAILPPQVTVVAVDVRKDKLEDAKQHGADITFQWGRDDTTPEVVGAYLAGGNPMLDGAIDFTGFGPVQERIFVITNPGATMALVGLGQKMMSPLPLHGIIVKAITLKGNMTGTKAQCSQVFDLMIKGKLKAPPITEVSLEDVEDVINKLHTGEQRGRAVVKM